MERFMIKVKVALLTLGLYLIAPFTSSAQNEGVEVLENSASAILELIDPLVRFMQIIMGAGAIVVLGIVIFKVYNGDTEAPKKMAWWILGVTLGFTLITVARGLIK